LELQDVFSTQLGIMNPELSYGMAQRPLSERERDRDVYYIYIYILFFIYSFTHTHKLTTPLTMFYKEVTSAGP